MSRSSLSRGFRSTVTALSEAIERLDKSLDPRNSIARIRHRGVRLADAVYIPQILSVVFWLVIMDVPHFVKVGIPVLYTIAILIPFTSQFFVPASPVLLWLITYFSSRFIPAEWRPPISVSLLPALESVLYGANISDILTRFTHPVLDIIAWLPYGVIHFLFPFIVAGLLWLFRPRETLHLWAQVFGYMNVTGVWVQILLPCAAPWYELIYGLTPANYKMHGSAGGLGRIDKLFGGHGYALAFGNSPVIFGAFPSLHAGCATMEALFLSHFFPGTTKYVWAYAGVLYWATMYLTHHYLIDVVGGACLSIAFFYIFLPDDFKGPLATAPPFHASGSKYDQYEFLQQPIKGGRGHLRGLSHLVNHSTNVVGAYDFELASDASLSDEEGYDITSYRSPTTSTVPKNGHRHTASIASVVHAGGENADENPWTPGFPPTPTRSSDRSAPSELDKARSGDV